MTPKNWGSSSNWLQEWLPEWILWGQWGAKLNLPSPYHQGSIGKGSLQQLVIVMLAIWSQIISKLTSQSSVFPFDSPYVLTNLASSGSVLCLLSDQQTHPAFFYASLIICILQGKLTKWWKEQLTSFWCHLHWCVKSLELCWRHWNYSTFPLVWADQKIALFVL